MRNTSNVRFYFHNLSRAEKIVTALLLIFSLSAAILNIWKRFIYIEDINYSLFVTPISIFIGFNITFLSIMTLSKYSTTLYSCEIYVNKTKTTLLHSMLLYYKTHIYFSFLIIVFIVLVNIAKLSNIYINSLFYFLVIVWSQMTIITFKYTFSFLLQAIISNSSE